MTRVQPTRLRAVAPGMSRPACLAGVLLACGVIVLVLAAPARPQQRPLGEADQTRVNLAIERGVLFLQARQQPTGSWADPKGSFQIGYAALPGLTLLECGIPTNDPTIQAVARLIRSKAATIDLTYELALSILFLDRLHNPDDEKLIQQLAVRLIAGQSQTGGWSYKCPILQPPTHQSLLTALRQSEPVSAVPLLLGLQPAPGLPNGVVGDPLDRNGGIAQVPGNPAPGNPVPGMGNPNAVPGQGVVAPGNLGAPGVGNPAASTGSSVTSPGSAETGVPAARPGDPLSLPDVRRPDVGGPRGPDAGGKAINAGKPGEGDRVRRSETTFGPSRRDWCIKMLEGDIRPESTPAPAKPTRPYVPPVAFRSLVVFTDVNQLAKADPAKREQEVVLQTTDNSNTQFAILALWTAQRHQVPMKRTLALVVRRFYLSQAVDGSWTYPFILGGGANDRPPMNCVGLLGLAVGLGLADGRNGGPPPIADARILKGFQAVSPRIGTPAGRMADLPQPNLYELWSIERVAVLYNLPTIAGKDWYRWGAETLVANQTAAGSWVNGGYPGSTPVADTCLALLFLKKANLASDLTGKLADTNDRLTQNIAAPLPSTPPPAADPADPKDETAVVNAPTGKEGTRTGRNSGPAQNLGQADDLSGKIGPGSPGKTAAPADRMKDNPAESAKEESSRPWWAIILFAVCLLTLAGVGITFAALHLRGKEAPRARPRKASARRPRTKD